MSEEILILYSEDLIERFKDLDITEIKKEHFKIPIKMFYEHPVVFYNDYYNKDGRGKIALTKILKNKYGSTGYVVKDFERYLKGNKCNN